MSQVIGFAGTFYTLWSFSNETVYTTDSYGQHWPVREKTNYNYIKNISQSLEAAMALYPELGVDEGLRGKHISFSTEKKEDDLCPQIMKYGKYVGHNLDELAVSDFNYVMWVAENGGGANRVYAQALPAVVSFIQNKAHAEQDLIDRNQAIYNRLLTSGTYTFIADRNLRTHENFGYMTTLIEEILHVTFTFCDYAVFVYQGREYALPTINGKAKRVKGKSITLTFTEDTRDVFQVAVTSITINR